MDFHLDQIFIGNKSLNSNNFAIFFLSEFDAATAIAGEQGVELGGQGKTTFRAVVKNIHFHFRLLVEDLGCVNFGHSTHGLTTALNNNPTETTNQVGPAPQWPRRATERNRPRPAYQLPDQRRQPLPCHYVAGPEGLLPQEVRRSDVHESVCTRKRKGTVSMKSS